MSTVVRAGQQEGTGPTMANHVQHAHRANGVGGFRRAQQEPVVPPPGIARQVGFEVVAKCHAAGIVAPQSDQPASV